MLNPDAAAATSPRATPAPARQGLQSRATGLDAPEAAPRRLRSGPNERARERPLAADFKLMPLPPGHFGWLLLTWLGPALLSTAMKRFCIRRCGWQ